MDRRRFLAASFAVSAAAALRPHLGTEGRSNRKRILVLGGTSFLGPAVVEAALVAGHTVTLFNRGITNPDLFPHIEKLRGLRSPSSAEENLSEIAQGTWDAVVDVWPSDPELAESAAKQLGSRSAHYLYVSSIAAYDPRGFSRPGLTEDAALNAWDLTIRPYDRGKAESERRLRAIVGDRLTIVRPGPIKGYRDGTPDLLAWLRRAQSGGRHIAPGDGTDHVQFVDANDVAQFLVLAIEHSRYGTFNLAGAPMTFREFVNRCVAFTRSASEFVWIPRAALHGEGLDPAPFNSPTTPSYLGKFPFWHPEPERRGFFQISSRRAFDAGWVQRPFDETAFNYLSWIDSQDMSERWTDELSAATEAAVLNRYRP
jgi:2'-hydroxyisoflavone reductase